MTDSLYERLGGTEVITRIANDLIDLHMENSDVATRYANTNLDELKNHAANFFIAGTGGPNFYTGKDMLATHKGMNISAHEFMAALDDTLAALQKNNIRQREQEEVLFKLYGMRSDIVLV